MSSTAIQASNLTKEYIIDYTYTESFKEFALNKFIKKKEQERIENSRLLALNDVSFEVREGEALGIIGKNGAGKSTLLKVLSGITKPTSGKVEIFGKLNSVLDIGVGLHPELTGRENIFMSGNLNGMSRNEVKKRLDEIIDFSEIEKFIDMPVKYYSSGMFLRLAFSIITHVDADILLLDEVMSVGDASFQLKSSKKLQSMFQQGKAIVLISHNPADIVKLCNRVIVLEKGKIIEDGFPSEVVTNYTEHSIIDSLEVDYLNNEKVNSDVSHGEIKGQKLQKTPKLRTCEEWDNMDNASGNDFFRFKKVEIKADGKKSGDPMSIDDTLFVEITYWKKDKDDIIDIALTLNKFGNIVFGSSTILSTEPEEMKLEGLVLLRMYIPPHLLNNSIYSIDIFAIKERKDTILSKIELIHFILNESNNNKIKSIKKEFPVFPGIIRPALKWEITNNIKQALK